MLLYAVGVFRKKDPSIETPIAIESFEIRTANRDPFLTYTLFPIYIYIYTCLYLDYIYIYIYIYVFIILCLYLLYIII